MSSISSSDVGGLKLNTNTKHLKSRRRSSQPVVVGEDLLNATAESKRTVSIEDLPRFARPTKSHIVRQASVKAERDLREHRIQHRKRIARGTGKHGQWKHISTADKMIGIPNPEKDMTYSTSLLFNNTSMIHNTTMNTTTSSAGSPRSVRGGGNNTLGSTTVPITHHIRVETPGRNSPNLSVGLEPAMARWGTEWGLRDKPSIPIGDQNSSLGVDMSPRSSPRQSRNSSFASSPLKPKHMNAPNNVIMTDDNDDDDDDDKYHDEIPGTTMQTGGRAGAGAGAGAGSSPFRLQRMNDPFLKDHSPNNDENNTRSRMEKTTKSWVDRQQLMLAESKNPLKSTIQEEREIEASEVTKKEWLNAVRKRRKVAKAAVRMANKYKTEMKQNEDENNTLNTMINSLPELFKKRVLEQVEKNRMQAKNIEMKMNGTSTTKMKAKMLQDQKLQEKKRKTPVPVETELFHQGGFNAHIEKMRQSRNNKKKLLKKATSTSGTWAPGHTIVKPFSFDKRTSNLSVSFVQLYVCMCVC
jgi:hypothetical protein